MTSYRRSAIRTFKHRPATSERMGWVKLVEAARTVAARASGHAFADDGRAASLTVDLKHLLRDAKAIDFPVQQASAVKLAEGLLVALRGFVECETPERREAYAPVLKASATAVMDMLEDLRAADASATWKKQFPAHEYD